MFVGLKGGGGDGRDNGDSDNVSATDFLLFGLNVFVFLS